MKVLVDRPRKEAALAIGATWLLFCLAFVAEEEQLDLGDVLAGALVGAILVVVGFAATSRCRPMFRRRNARRAGLAALSLCAGIAAGAVILGAQVGLTGDHSQLARRVSEPSWRPLTRAFGAGVVEEVACRLFGMSGIAWITARYVKRPGLVFPVALSVSALLFGLVHLPDFSWVGLTVVLLNGLGGLLLGWIFWRWGLAYAILCHFAGGVVIQSLGPRLFGR